MTRDRFGPAVLLGLLAVAWPVADLHAQGDAAPILDAMRDELTRSMAELHLEGEPRPYYVAYEVTEVLSTRISAELGAILTDDDARSARLQVEVRVGDYDFDSSRFVAAGRGGIRPVSGTASTSAPIDHDYDALRRELWTLTDAAYKRAVTAFARKKAARQNRIDADPLPDLSRETPAETVDEMTVPRRGDLEEWADGLRQISTAFAANSDLLRSEASLFDSRGTRYFINTEGFTAVTPLESASLRVSAETRAEDGTIVRDVFAFTETSVDAFPPLADLTARAREMADRLSVLRTAPQGEDYTGPVLLEGQASAELVAQAFVPLMLARREPEAENPRVIQAVQSQLTPFLSRIGLRVLPDSFSVRDTPSLERFDGRPVPGAYTADDEGMPGQDVALVEKGRLVTLLTSRTPQRNLLQSNGHGRGGDVLAGVFQIQTSEPMSPPDLKAEFLRLLKLQNKPFGYIVRGVASPGDVPGGGGPDGGPVILNAVRVLQDGTEEPVRGLRFGDVNFRTFRDILEASEERTLYSYRDRGGAVVSVIVPTLMFEELDIRPTTEITEVPPIVPPPPMTP